jgi:hypothetical protein
MATHAHSKQFGHMVEVPVIKMQGRWLRALVLVLAVALLTVVILMLARPATSPVSNVQRGRAADAARYTALAEAYLGTGAVSRARAMRAETARLQGLADYTLATREAARHRAATAYAARYTGLAEVYLTKLANQERARAAYAARLTGLAEVYAGQGSIRADAP